VCTGNTKHHTRLARQEAEMSDLFLEKRRYQSGLLWLNGCGTRLPTDLELSFLSPVHSRPYEQSARGSEVRRRGQFRHQCFRRVRGQCRYEVMSAP
jgi:hypothetical protein